MDGRRWIVAAVIVLLVVVGGTFVLISLLSGDDTGGQGDQSVTVPSLVDDTALAAGAAA